MQPPHRRRVHLQRQPPVLGVAPAHGQHLDLGRVHTAGQVRLGELAALGHEAEPVGARPRRRHPHVRVRRVLDARGAREGLLGRGEALVHGVAGDEGRGAEGDDEGVAGAVVVADGLEAAGGDAHGEEGGHDGRGEAVERGVNVPAVEARVGEVVGGGDGGGVEGAVVGVAEGDVFQAFVGGDVAVADDLDLGLVGDGLEVGVQDAAGLGGEGGGPVAVRGRQGVEAVGELVLGARRQVGLVLKDEDLVLEEGGADDGKVGI